MKGLLYASLGTGFTFLMTTLGSALVYLFKKEPDNKTQRVFLGFAAGVMISASFWSLLLPAIEESEKMGVPGWIPSAFGFALGVVFLMMLNLLLPHLHIDQNKPSEKYIHKKRTTLLVTAVTLHNIPEGMAVGLAFALAMQEGNMGNLSAAMALALGIGIQNFPEGAAISLPLRKEGLSRTRSFLYGSMSGIVEPIFGISVVLLAGTVSSIMPWLLSFAAGAMIYVTVEELIPESQMGEHSNLGTISIMVGFLIMMILDTALG